MTRTFQVEIALPNPTGRLRPGMYGTARIVAETIPDSLMIPSSCVLLNDGQAICSRIIDGQLVRTSFRPGESGYRAGSNKMPADDNEYLIVKEGLSEGDVISLQRPSKTPANEQNNSQNPRR